MSSFYFAGFGGVERGKGTGTGTDNRSIRERHTALFIHVLRGERNRGHEEGEPISVEWCTPLHPPPFI